DFLLGSLVLVLGATNDDRHERGDLRVFFVCNGRYSGSRISIQDVYSYVYVSFRKGELSGRTVVIELSSSQGFCALGQLKDVSKSITNNHLFCANRFCRTLPKGYSL